MSTLYIDYETKCALDLRRVGPYRYIADPSFDLLLVSFAVDDGKIYTNFGGEDSFLHAVFQLADRIVAHNVGFERLVTARLGFEVDPELWSCTSARARNAGLPASLDGVAAALGLEMQKDKRGKQLIRLYSMPQKDGTFREMDEEARQDWTRYSQRDVELLRTLDSELPELSVYEQRIFVYDMVLNDRGIGIDKPLLQSCSNVIAAAVKEIDAELKRLTGVVVTSSTQRNRMLSFVSDHAYSVDDLSKQNVQNTLRTDLPERVRRMLELRTEGARTSTGKLQAMANRAVGDRLHGMLHYYGAHTGRHSSVGVQLQNLPRPERDWWMLQEATHDLLEEDLDRLRVLYGSPIGLVADMLRSLLVPKPGRVFEIVDLHAVELRGAAWLAGEQWVLDALQQDIDVYCATASALFGRTVSPKDERERFLGKTIELAGQYGMGWTRFQKTCAMQGVTVDDYLAKRSVATYREMHPRIVAMWHTLEKAARYAVEHPGTACSNGKLGFKTEERWLLLRLPSGRCLTYFEPRLTDEGLSYRGVNSVTHKFEPQRLWGSMLFEHATQALCRDILMEGCARLEVAGHPVRLLVHDETVSEVPIECADIKRVEMLMATSPTFAPDLPLQAKGKVVERYRKI